MKTKQLLGLLLSGSLILSVFSGCGQTDESGSANLSGASDISDASGIENSTQDTSSPQTDGERVRIVFEFQNSHVHDDFEPTLESLFDVDIIMDINQSSNAYLRLQEELTHNMAPDLVLCEYMKRIDDEVLSEFFYDLSAESFVNNYYLSAVESCTSADGGLYYLPGPCYVYGIVYDKTAFRELGLSVPKNYTEFVELCRKVDEMGLVGQEPDPDDETKMIDVPVKAFVPTVKWVDMFQIIFNTMNYESSFRGISNAKWLRDYQNGEGSMVGHMEPAAEKYLKLFEDGVLSLDFWKVKAPYRSKKLYVYHTSLMTIECQQGFEFNKSFSAENPEDAHEIGMMPIFTSDEPDTGYLYSIPRSLFGITKQAAQDPEKLDMLLKIMDYLSTPEGQKLLINGSDYFGFIKNDISLDSDFYSEVTDTINNGRIISAFYYTGENGGDAVESYFHDHTADLVDGRITVQEWLKEADKVRDAAIVPSEKEVFGTVTETMIPLQTAYIDGLIYLHAMDADIGYVPVAADYGTQAYLFSGDITEEKICFISAENSFVSNPAEGDMEYVVVEMTGQELLDLAKKGTSNGMAAFAGVDMEYDITKNDGSQYVSLKINGEEMDMSRTYRVASLRGAVSKARVVAEYKDLNFVDMFKSYLSEAAGGTISPPEQLKIIG